MDVNYTAMDRSQLLAYVSMQNRIIDSLKRELELRLRVRKKDKPKRVTIQMLVLRTLESRGPLTANKLANIHDMDSARIAQALVRLQVKGQVQAKEKIQDRTIRNNPHVLVWELTCKSPTPTPVPTVAQP